MLRLITFGGLALEPNGTPVVPRVRPPRLALLALLAATGDRGVTRERLVALFWPEADEDHGRHSLRQALYALRNEAGQDVVHAGPALQLNSQALTSDIEEFRLSLGRGDRRRAVDLYRGPFLDGFYLSGSSEFERWVEQERTRLAQAASSALLELAGESAAAGRHDESARWWQRLNLLEPLSARFVLGYAHARLASGDRPQALAAIRAHQSLVRQELEVEPDPELKRLELQIRSHPEAPQPAAAAATPVQPTPPDPVSSGPARDVKRPRGFRRRSAAIAAGALSFLAFLGARKVLAPPAEPAASVLERPFTYSTLAASFYAEGLRAYRTGDALATRRLMRAALREDSTFAMAAYLAALASEQPEAEVRQRALRLAANAPERERLTIMADLLGGDMDPSGLAVAEGAAAKYPDEPGLLRALGMARFHAGDWAGAVAALDRVISLAGDRDGGNRENCLSCEAVGHLAETYWWWDSLPAVERTARRAMELNPSDNWPFAMLAMVGARMGDSATAFTNLRQFVASAPGPMPKNHELAVLLTLELYDRVEQEVQPLLASARRDESGTGRWMLLIALRNQGRLDDAEELLKTGRIGTSTPIPAVALHLDQNEALIAQEGGNPQRAAAFFDMIRNTSHHPAPGQVARWRAWNSLLMGTALAAAGDTAAVRRLADTVQYWGERSLYGRDRKGHHFLRGLLLAAQGKDEDAVAAYRAAVHSWSFGYTRVNYELARALLRLGRPADAIPVLQPALRGSIDASNLYITRTDLHELLAQAFDQAGQPDSAAAHYRSVVQAWRRADPQFRSRRQAAEARLNHLATRPRPPQSNRSAS